MSAAVHQDDIQTPQVDLTPISSAAVHTETSTKTPFGFSREESSSLVPCTPELCSFPNEEVENGKMKQVPTLPEDPLTDFNQNRNIRRSSRLRKDKIEYAKENQSFKPQLEPVNEKRAKSSDGTNSSKNRRGLVELSTSMPKSTSMLPQNTNAFLQVVRPMGILVPKNDIVRQQPQQTIKIWISDFLRPLSISGKNFGFNLEPVDATIRNFDAVVPCGPKRGSDVEQDVSCDKDTLNREDNNKNEARNCSGGNCDGCRGQSCKGESCKGETYKHSNSQGENVSCSGENCDSCRGQSCKGETYNNENRKDGTSQVESCIGQSSSSSQSSSRGDQASIKGQNQTKYYRFRDLDRNMLVKASKFQVNGEECYLIPARLIMKPVRNSNSTCLKGQKSKLPRPNQNVKSHTTGITNSASLSVMNQNEGDSDVFDKDGIDVPINKMRVTSIKLKKDWTLDSSIDTSLENNEIAVEHRGYTWHLEEPVPQATQDGQEHEQVAISNREERTPVEDEGSTPVVEDNGRTPVVEDKGRTPVVEEGTSGPASWRYPYPSILSAKSGKLQKTTLRISKLVKTSTNDGTVCANTSISKENKAENSPGEHRGPENWKENDKEISKESDNAEMKMQNDKTGPENSNESHKDLGEIDSSCILQYVIGHSNPGTFIYAEGKDSRAIKLIEPTLKIKAVKNLTMNGVDGKDQVVPDLQQKDGVSGKTFLNEIEEEGRKTKTNYETVANLREIQALIGNSDASSEADLVIKASNYIMSLEVRIRAIMKELGCDIPRKTMIELFENEGRRPSAVDEGSSSQPKTTPAPQLPKNSPDNEFLVPQDYTNRPQSSESSFGNLPEVPNLDRTTSPELAITRDATWSPSEAQVNFSQGRSRSVFPISSQLSFSESITDDSQNVHEFDLFFEKENSPKDEAGILFNPYVGEVYDNFEIDELTSCVKESPQATAQPISYTSISTPDQALFSPSRDRLYLSDHSSPVIETPRTFSVNSLDYDIEREISPRWYQTVDQGIVTPDMMAGVQGMAGNLSMKVVNKKRNKNSDGKIKRGKRKKSIDKEDKLVGYSSDTFMGRSEEDRLAAELLSSLWETEQRDGPSDRHPLTTDSTLPVNGSMKDDDEDLTALRHLESLALVNQKSLEAPKVVLAKDLVESDLLASFLYPRPTVIPEDPFGIGAETIIERSIDVVASEEVEMETITCEQTSEAPPRQSPVVNYPPQSPFVPIPPQSRLDKSPQVSRLDATVVSPNSEKLRRRKRKWVGANDDPIQRRRRNRRRKMDFLQESPNSCKTDSEDESIFVPDISRLQTFRKKRIKSSRAFSTRKHENFATIPESSKMETVKTRSQKTRNSAQRRKALKLIN